jgi:hypothetical protein
MAPGGGGNRGRQILIEVGIARAGNVPREESAPAAFRVHEIETAIDDGEVRFAHQLLKRGRAD